MAGVIPGILLGLMLMAAIYVVARMSESAAPAAARAGPRCSSPGADAIWGLLLIVIILGGIYGGIFTPTEAAAVAAVYAFLVAPVRLSRHGLQGCAAGAARQRAR